MSLPRRVGDRLKNGFAGPCLINQVRETSWMAYVPPVRWLSGVSREPWREREVLDRSASSDEHKYISVLRKAVARGEVDPIMHKWGPRARAKEV